MKAGSFIVASKARRSASTRSAGTSGGRKYGRPYSVRANSMASACRSASVLASSSIEGTSASSAWRLRPYCAITLIFFSAIHCGTCALTAAQPMPPLPWISPRSMAWLICGVPS